MKKVILLTALLGGFFALSMNAQNVLTDAWEIKGFQGNSDGTISSPSSTGFAINLPAANNQGIYQELELEAGKSYTLSGNSAGTWAQAWFQIHISELHPNDLGDEVTGSNDVWQFTDAHAWGSAFETAPNGPLSSVPATPADEQGGITFTPTKTNTYYIIFKIGCEGNVNITLSGLALTAAEASGLNNVIAGVQISSEAGQIIVNAEGSVAIYNTNGLLIESGVANGAYTSQDLAAGLYIVNVNGQAQKVLVK